jgi:hypothetical protein
VKAYVDIVPFAPALLQNLSELATELSFHLQDDTRQFP